MGQLSVLPWLGLGLVTASGCQHAAAEFTARFRVNDFESIVLDYWDPLNFSLTPQMGAASVCVVRGRIHLVVTPSLATAGRERVLWVGELKSTPDVTAMQPVRLLPTALPPALQDGWQLGTPVHDVRVSSRPPASLQPEVVASVARLPQVARAQYVIDTTMRASMDMTLCGDAVNRLVLAWSPHLTALGLAVVASSVGVDLAGPLQRLKTPPALPTGVLIENYRIRPIRPIQPKG
ncbi:MAG: hypothetical protein HEQ39_19245 [Rhizobacter sp.]